MYQAEATHVVISIKDVNGKICLVIAGDGKGLEQDQQTQSSGLTHIPKITASINGEISIDSAPGKGPGFVLLSQNNENRSPGVIA